VASLNFDPPNAEQPSESLGELFAAAKEADRRIEMYGRKTKDEIARRGELLIKAKAKCPHGEWLAALKKHWPGLSVRRAQEWMKEASPDPEGTPVKCAVAAHLTDDEPTAQETGEADPEATPVEEPKPAELPRGGAATTWEPADFYADQVKKGIAALKRFQAVVSALLDSPFREPAFDLLNKYGPRWSWCGEHNHVATVAGLRVMGRLYDCHELNELIAQAGTLANEVRRMTPETAGPFDAKKHEENVKALAAAAEQEEIEI
jgi:hypothetical protein